MLYSIIAFAIIYQGKRIKTSKKCQEKLLNVGQKLRSSNSEAMARALLKSRFCEIEGGLSEKLFEDPTQSGRVFFAPP
jgi:hypothetical protein